MHSLYFLTIRSFFNLHGLSYIDINVLSYRQTLCTIPKISTTLINLSVNSLGSPSQSVMFSQNRWCEIGQLSNFPLITSSSIGNVVWKMLSQKYALCTEIYAPRKFPKKYTQIFIVTFKKKIETQWNQKSSLFSTTPFKSSFLTTGEGME